MKLKYIVFIIILCAGHGMGAMIPNDMNLHDISSGVTLNTEGGIVDGKTCTLYNVQEHGVLVSEYIDCDGTKFENLGKIESPSTGTVLPNSYSNYIGSYVKSPARRPLPMMLFGDELAVYYFNGEPQQR